MKVDLPELSGKDGFSIPEPFLRMQSAVIALFDTDGRLIRASRGFERMLDIVPDAAADAGIRGLFVLPGFDELVGAPPGAASVPVFEGILTLGALATTSRSIRGAVYRDGDRLLLIGEHDIEELERLSSTVLKLNEELAEAERELVRKNRQLEQLARTDPLTGVANRRELAQRLQLERDRCLRLASPLSVIVADIDYFKRVNDTYGHTTGDAVLRHVAELLQQHSRRYDVVARFGGEEFVVLLPETSLATAVDVAERMRLTLATADIAPLAEPVTASFGVASMTCDEPGDSLLGRADRALYQAKERGRNRVVSQD